MLQFGAVEKGKCKPFQLSVIESVLTSCLHSKQWGKNTYDSFLNGLSQEVI